MMDFDTGLQDFFMYLFFVSVGFGASILILKQSGSTVIKFLGIAALLCLLQNSLEIYLSPLLGVNKALGLMTGSTPMTGGHGTAAAIAPMLQELGFGKTETVAYASATFGLVTGSLLGGPLATRLIEKKHLMKKRRKYPRNLPGNIIEYGDFKLDGDRILKAFFALLISMF